MLIQYKYTFHVPLKSLRSLLSLDLYLDIAMDQLDIIIIYNKLSTKIVNLPFEYFNFSLFTTYKTQYIYIYIL